MEIKKSNTKTVYTIYEVIGHSKIGCTDDFEARVGQHTKKYGVSKDQIKILEKHTDIYLASDRERELQRSNGYPLDKQPYWYVVQVKLPKTKTESAKKKRVESMGSFRDKQIHRAKTIKVFKVKLKRIGSYTQIVKKTYYKTIKGVAETARQLGFKHCIGVSRVLNNTAKSYKGYTFVEISN